MEELFSDNGPKPWHTKPGQSKLDGLIEEVREKNLQVKDVVENVHKDNAPAEVSAQPAEKAIREAEVV